MVGCMFFEHFLVYELASDTDSRSVTLSRKEHGKTTARSGMAHGIGYGTASFLKRDHEGGEHNRIEITIKRTVCSRGRTEDFFLLEYLVTA